MSDGWRDEWSPGEAAHYEYHCNRSHDSEDAPLWYRSHRTVTVLSIGEPGIGDTIHERLEIAEVRTYRIRFADGHESEAFEDEIFVDPAHLDPDMGPPGDDEITAAGGIVPRPDGERS